MQTFSELGRVIKVRLVTDADTGKPRGYAFVEYEDPQAALSAIRNMNDYELNGRRVRVNFSSSSHLEVLANKLGMDLSQQTQRPKPASSGGVAAAPTSTGTNAVADALKGLSKGEMYDIVAKFKEIADSDPEEARRLLSGHPQLPEALLFLMSKLDMIQTSISTDAMPGVMNPLVGAMAGLPATRAADPRARDPRAAAAAARSDPRAAAIPPTPPVADPRARMDPRARAAPPAPPPPLLPPPQPPQFGVVPPPPPPAATAGVANLDPGLIQQVMSLTPQQILQLPPDKQQSILALRQQISGTRM